MTPQPISATPATEGLPGEELDKGPADPDKEQPRKNFVPSGLNAPASVDP